MDVKEVIEAGRITVDIGVRAYQETGLLPVQGHNKFCGMGAVSAAAQLPSQGFCINSELACYSHSALTDILGVPYVLGFANGFDGNYTSLSVVTQQYGEEAGSRYYQGHEDGYRLWKAVKYGPPIESGAGEAPGEIQEERELVLA